MLNVIKGPVSIHSKFSLSRKFFANCCCSKVISSITPIIKVSNRTMSSSKLKPADRTLGQTESVWIVFNQLAAEHKPVDLGQGFIDFPAPEHIRKALCSATLDDSRPLLNQYTRGFGHLRLVNAIGKLYSQLSQRTIDPLKEIIITTGAYAALYYSIMGNINPGDEVIVIEPFYDCYEPMIKMAGGTPVFIPLRNTSSSQVTKSCDWKLDEVELASKFSAKTKAIIVNTPNNPLGKVYSRSELEYIASLAIKWDTLVISDEVYEWVIYPGTEHTRIATLPGMWDRTITIGSVGKTFSVTGWKIGWAYGPYDLIRGLQMIHQNCVFTNNTTIQEAIAVGFETEIERLNTPESYFKELNDYLIERRDALVPMLLEAGMNPIIPEGGYFLIADFSELAKKVPFEEGANPDETRDVRFVKWLIRNKKLQGIPPSVFYSDDHKGLAANHIRFCFFKQESTLAKAAEILREIKNASSKQSNN